MGLGRGVVGSWLSLRLGLAEPGSVCTPRCGYKSAPLAHVLISSDQRNESRELSVQAVRRRWASSHLGLFVGFSVLPLGHCSLGDGVGAGTGLNIEDPDS